MADIEVLLLTAEHVVLIAQVLEHEPLAVDLAIGAHTVVDKISPLCKSMIWRPVLFVHDVVRSLGAEQNCCFRKFGRCVIVISMQIHTRVDVLAPPVDSALRHEQLQPTRVDCPLYSIENGRGSDAVEVDRVLAECHINCRNLPGLAPILDQSWDLNC